MKNEYWWVLILNKTKKQLGLLTLNGQTVASYISGWFLARLSCNTDQTSVTIWHLRTLDLESSWELEILFYSKQIFLFKCLRKKIIIRKSSSICVSASIHLSFSHLFIVSVRWVSTAVSFPLPLFNSFSTPLFSPLTPFFPLDIQADRLASRGLTHQSTVYTTNPSLFLGLSLDRFRAGRLFWSSSWTTDASCVWVSTGLFHTHC